MRNRNRCERSGIRPPFNQHLGHPTNNIPKENLKPAWVQIVTKNKIYGFTKENRLWLFPLQIHNNKLKLNYWHSLFPSAYISKYNRQYQNYILMLIYTAPQLLLPTKLTIHFLLTIYNLYVQMQQTASLVFLPCNQVRKMRSVFVCMYF